MMRMMYVRYANSYLHEIYNGGLNAGPFENSAHGLADIEE